MRRLNGQRAQFEQRADELREKLVHTIDALEHRRHELLDVRYQVRRHAGGVAAAGLTAVLVTGALTVGAVQRARRRDERLRRERIRMLARFWRDPDRAAALGKPSVLREIGRRLLVGTITFVAMQLIRRGLRVMMAPPPRLEPARRVVPITRRLPD
jgi:hypothetical protein